jgi:HK97 gp10 family phage protein
MPGASVEIRANHFAALAESLPDVVGRLIETAAVNTERGAKVRAPVRTGFLRNSIKGQMTGQTSAEVVAAAEYAGFVEYGTVRMHARPYLTPAWEGERVKLVNALQALEQHWHV